MLSMMEADWRSIARRNDCGKDIRVASRSRSCPNRSCSPSSTRRPARTASASADINDAGWRSNIAASNPAENRSGSTAATRTTSEASLESRSSRCCMHQVRRRGRSVSGGHHSAATEIEPALLVQTADQLHGEERIS